MSKRERFVVAVPVACAAGEQGASMRYCVRLFRGNSVSGTFRKGGLLDWKRLVATSCWSSAPVIPHHSMTFPCWKA